MSDADRIRGTTAEIWPEVLREETVAPFSDGIADTEARARCPWCSSLVSIGLDPGSGPEQAYAEDCPVCCRAWSVTVRYGPSGRAEVRLEREGDA